MTYEEFWRRAVIKANVSYDEFLEAWHNFKCQSGPNSPYAKTGYTYFPNAAAIDSAEADNLIRSIGCQPPEKEGK